MSRDDLFKMLEEGIKNSLENGIDEITFAGNGEPTLHPDFLEIAKFMAQMRDEYCEDDQIVLLTNGTTLHKSQIKSAMDFIDTIAIKLDAGTDDLLNLIDSPLSPVHISELVEKIQSLSCSVTIQTMFIKGEKNGIRFDNTSEENILSWMNILQQLEPEEVMIYSVSRDTPLESIEAIPLEKLKEIARRVEDLGLKTLVV
jgi:wyosine [tRNA(Phe)-imidazoG37] synthetase (radical SAM superfamily)